MDLTVLKNKNGDMLIILGVKASRLEEIEGKVPEMMISISGDDQSEIEIFKNKKGEPLIPLSTEEGVVAFCLDSISYDPSKVVSVKSLENEKSVIFQLSKFQIRVND